MALYDNVKKICSEQGISICALEREVGIGNGTISRWNESNPTVDKLKKVADYFGVSMDYFLKEEV